MNKSTNDNVKNSKEAYFSTEDDSLFTPQIVHRKVFTLPPGLYNVTVLPNIGVCFKQKKYDELNLLTLDDSVTTKAVKEINSFWKKKDLFIENDFPFRRGILLYGPPGSGKTCAIRMIINHIIELNGIALIYENAALFKAGMDALRSVQPDIPVVVVMEDIDRILLYDNVSELLNVLDGLSGHDNIVYLATTNYISQLEGRIKNRPSRFDVRYFIDFPNEKSRKMYLEFISKKYNNNLPLDKWAHDTAGFSLAHLKELYLSVMFFENNYDETLNRLKSMNSKADYDSDDSAADAYDGDYHAELEDKTMLLEVTGVAKATAPMC